MKNNKVVVIGGGPAGLSAALWLKNLGFMPVVLEKEPRTGGMQNFNFLPNDWVLGQLDSTGVGIAKHFQQHIDSESIEVHVGCELVYMQPVNNVSDTGFDISVTINGESQVITCRAIILANGTRYRGRDVLACDGLDAVAEKYIVEGPYCFNDIESLDSQRIVIVGAGDNAFENALMLLEKNCQVFMVSRSIPKAQTKFTDKVIGHPNFSLFESSKITSVSVVNSAKNRESHRLSVSFGQKELLVDKIHVLAGYQPNSEEMCSIISSGIGQSLQCDQQGFVIVDESNRTNIPNIYAAGDICNKQFPCVVTALSGGALAAKTISQDVM